MRPHTELRLDAAHHCLGQPASSSRPTPTPTPAHRLQASWGLKEEGARCEAADPRAPTGLLNEWAARCRQSAWGQSQVYTSTKRNIRETSQRETTAEGPDSSSLHETLHRSVYSCLITQQSFFFEHSETSCSRWESLLAQWAVEVKNIMDSRVVSAGWCDWSWHSGEQPACQPAFAGLRWRPAGLTGLGLTGSLTPWMSPLSLTSAYWSCSSWSLTDKITKDKRENMGVNLINSSM